MCQLIWRGAGGRKIRENLNEIEVRIRRREGEGSCTIVFEYSWKFEIFEG